MDKLTTVHDAVHEAALEPKKDQGPMGTHTFRIHTNLKVQAKQLCENHGTTLDEFLRKCCEGLIKDYHN